MGIKWSGVFPAVTTKFTENDELDFVAFDINIAAQLEAGAEGIILGGSLGEASVLTDDEKFELLSHTIAFVEVKSLFCSTSQSLQPRKQLRLHRKQNAWVRVVLCCCRQCVITLISRKR
jgi:dihydrodipicolinate synthase/N-acetylneuraminate lyase